jgi:hypothetical protein
MPASQKPGESHKGAYITASAVIVAALISYYAVHRPAPVPLVPNEFTGQVLDDNGKPIYNAKIVVNLDQHAPQRYSSDSDGFFHIELPPDTKNMHISVSNDGYVTDEREVSPSRSGAEHIILRSQKKPTMPSTPVVLGNRRREAPIPPVSTGQSGLGERIPDGAQDRQQRRAGVQDKSVLGHWSGHYSCSKHPGDLDWSITEGPDGGIEVREKYVAHFPIVGDQSGKVLYTGGWNGRTAHLRTESQGGYRVELELSSDGQSFVGSYYGKPGCTEIELHRWH